MRLATMTCVTAILAVGSLAAPAAQAQSAGETFYNQRMKDPILKLPYTGEHYCWGAVYDTGNFVDGYEATHDASYLDFAVKYYDGLLARMATGPDGYKGWIGPYVYDKSNNTWCDVHVGDALLFGAMLDFGHLVTSDPALKEKYGAKATEYVESAKRNFFDKWDARGTWHEDGPVGFYRSWNMFGAPNQFTDWKPLPYSTLGDSSLPFNKQLDVGVVALRIWQITGDEKYKHRAEMIFGYLKSRMQQFKDEYHWDYWEPAAQFDIVSDQPGHQLFQWVGVHPERPGYQSGEVANIVKAYNAGIVFTEQDMRSIVNTNLKVMWNGNMQNPQFDSSNADLRLTGERSHAGELWGSLAPFDATIRQMVGQHLDGAIAKEYFQNVTAKNPPSYQRTDVSGPVEIPRAYAQFPMGNQRTVTVAAVMPGVFASGQKTDILCKLVEAGNLEVALYSADGKTKLAVLHQGRHPGGPGGRDGVFILPFTGTDPASGKAFEPGDYRVRWTVAGDGYCEFPITIQAAK